MAATCDRCGRREVCILVYVDHDDSGHPTGPFELRCVRCQRHDGDPWSVMHGTQVHATARDLDRV